MQGPRPPSDPELRDFVEALRAVLGLAPLYPQPRTAPEAVRFYQAPVRSAWEGDGIRRLGRTG